MNEEKEFDLKGTLKIGTSKTGNEYTYLELKLDNDYSKKVFLDSAEIVLLKKSNNNFMPFLKNKERD